MSTTPIVATTATGGGVNISFILTILQVAMTALQTIPAIGGDIKLASAFISIIQNAMNAFHSAAGVPLDLSKLPLETPVQ
jgi:hypothetical protein